jgi:LysR family transcriptional regulator, cell division regulator
VDSSQLRIFAAVAQAGSITRAADTLHTVQSNVTMHIKALEEELGLPLLHRHPRGVTLTRAGELLLPFAIKIEGVLGEARQAVAGPHRRPRGALRIGTLETTAAIRLPQIVAKFGARYPEVDLSLATGTTGMLSRDVLAYRLEGAFVAGPALNPELLEEKVFTEELAVITGPRLTNLSHLATSTEEAKILVFREGCSYRTSLERILQSRGVRKIKVIEFGTLDGIIGCAAAGLGITMLPTALLKTALGRRKLRVHPLPPAEARVETVFIRRRDGFVSPALRAFLEFVRRSSPQARTFAQQRTSQLDRAARSR